MLIRTGPIKTTTMQASRDTDNDKELHLQAQWQRQGSVMWSKTVSLRTRPVSQQKIGLDLGLGLACCVCVCVSWSKHNPVPLVAIMILKDTATFQVLFTVSLFCAWNITNVEINSTYLKFKSAKCLCLLAVVLVLILVLRIWSCLHHWQG